MKTLFEFTINKPTEKEVKIEEKDQTVIKKVTENVPVKIVLKNPSRSDISDADLFYSIQYSDLQSKGLLTEAMVRRIYSERGGILSKDDEKKLEDTRSALLMNREDYFKLADDLNNEKNEEKKEAIEKKLTKKRVILEEILTEIQAYESALDSLFVNTVENKAKNQLLFWWVLFLPYIEEDEELVPLFKGEEFIDRRKTYDDITDLEDVFYNEVLKRILILIPLWDSGQVETAEDFKTALDEILSQNGEDVPVEEVADEPEVPEVVEADEAAEPAEKPENKKSKKAAKEE